MTVPLQWFLPKPLFRSVHTSFHLFNIDYYSYCRHCQNSIELSKYLCKIQSPTFLFSLGRTPKLSWRRPYAFSEFRILARVIRGSYTWCMRVPTIHGMSLGWNKINFIVTRRPGVYNRLDWRNTKYQCCVRFPRTDANSESIDIRNWYQIF